MRNTKKALYKLIFTLFSILFMGAAGLMAYEEYQLYKTQQQLENLVDAETETESETETETESETETEEKTDELAQLNIQVPEKNIDWEALKKENKHVYAWIYIPETNVDYPIVQHPTDVSFYLRRGLNGKKLTAGCIYTEYYNKMDFTDPNTLIYGHNMRNKTMFATIHNYEDKTFFENNRYIYIYMPDKVLVYDVFAAYIRDDKHLLLCYDYDTEENIQKNFDAMFTVGEQIMQYKDGVELTPTDKVITLSTCVRGQDKKRYVVHGLLVNPSALVNETDNGTTEVTTEAE